MKSNYYDKLSELILKADEEYISFKHKCKDISSFLIALFKNPQIACFTKRDELDGYVLWVSYPQSNEVYKIPVDKVIDIFIKKVDRIEEEDIQEYKEII